MLCHVYLRKGKVFIPTLGRVPGGPYRDIEPVTVVDVSDADGLHQAFRETIARGNLPVGPYPRPNPPPVVLKHAGVKSWGAFARWASPWVIDERDGKYQIIWISARAKQLGARSRTDGRFSARHDAGSGGRPHDRDSAERGPTIAGCSRLPLTQ
jgi:hypothetical protein